MFLLKGRYIRSFFLLLLPVFHAGKVSDIGKYLRNIEKDSEIGNLFEIA